MRDSGQVSRFDLAVIRGRDASYQLQDVVRNHIAQGTVVVSIHIAQSVADDMHAHFHSIAHYDGKLPKAIWGVPLYIGGNNPGEDCTVKLHKPTETFQRVHQALAVQ